MDDENIGAEVSAGRRDQGHRPLQIAGGGVTQISVAGNSAFAIRRLSVFT